MAVAHGDRLARHLDVNRATEALSFVFHCASLFVYIDQVPDAPFRFALTSATDRALSSFEARANDRASEMLDESSGV
jgi:hypothetical protein